VWRQSYRVGVPTAPLQQGEPSDDTGTTVTFWPSQKIFETTVFDYETLRSRFQQYAFLNKGLQITLIDERPEHADEDGTAPAVTFRYDGGLVDYVRHLNASKKTEAVNP
jgi:DNA gyrase subunit B